MGAVPARESGQTPGLQARFPSAIVLVPFSFPARPPTSAEDGGPLGPAGRPGGYLVGQSFLPRERLRGREAGQAGWSRVEEPPINRKGVVPVVLFLLVLLLLSCLPSHYRPLFLLLHLPGGFAWQPAFPGAEAVGVAPWRPSVSLATGPLPPQLAWG